MPNDLKVQDIIVREAQYQLKNSLVLGNLVNRQHEAEFTQDVNGIKKGATVRVKRPENFIPGTGAAISIADAEEATTTVTVDTQLNKGLAFTSQELTLLLSGPQGARRIGEEKIKPLMHSFANKIDTDLAALYKFVPGWVGTPGQVIDAFTDYYKGEERLNELSVPTDMRYASISPADHAALVGSFNNYYDNSTAKNALQRAKIPMMGGTDAYMSQNVPTHIVGPLGGTPLVNGGAQAVTYATAKATMTQTFITDGWTAAAALRVRAGDVFTIPNVFAVNVIGKQTLPFLRQFTVMADGSSDAAGNLTLTISPPIITSGPYQTVSAAPADNAGLTFVGTANTGYRQNMVFHKDALHLAVVPLEIPTDGGVAARINEDGLSVRVVSGYNISTDVQTWRFDILYGVTALRPDLAVRLSGT